MTPDVYARSDETKTADGRSIQHDPKFELEYAFDNMHRPTEVTVSDRNAGSSIFTSWISTPIENAVPLEEIR